MSTACGSLDGAFFAWSPQGPRGLCEPPHRGELFSRAPLHELAERLDPVRFARVHRSAIVNIESILHLEPISHGEFEVILKDGSRSRISRTYRRQLEKRLGQSL